MSFNGQRCSAIKIIFVHEAVKDEFLEKFSAAIGSKKFGMPWEEGVAFTPLPEPGKPDFLTELLEDARQHGAQVINPGGGMKNRSFFYPAVVYPVNEQMRLYHEEQFGPVIPVVPFDGSGNAHSVYYQLQLRPAGQHIFQKTRTLSRSSSIPW